MRERERKWERENVRERERKSVHKNILVITDALSQSPSNRRRAKFPFFASRHNRVLSCDNLFSYIHSGFKIISFYTLKQHPLFFLHFLTRVSKILSTSSAVVKEEEE
jgi:hypothetical protein